MSQCEESINKFHVKYRLININKSIRLGTFIIEPNSNSMTQKNAQFRLFLISLCLFILAIVFSCNRSAESEGEDGITEIKVNRDLAKDIQINEAIRIKKWVALETSPESMIGWINNFNYMNNEFYLSSDFKTLLRFSSDGNFLNKIGNKGSGPGEFLDVANVIVDPASQKVEVYGRIKKKMLIYNVNGEYESSFHLDYWRGGFSKLPGGQYLIFDRIPEYFGNDIQSEYTLFLLNDNQYPEKLDSVIPMYHGNMDFGAKFHNFFQYQNKTIFHYGLNDTIYEFDGKELVHKYHIDFGNEVSIKEIGEIPDRIDAMKVTSNPLYSQMGSYVIVTDALTFAEYNYKNGTQRLVKNRVSKKELNYINLKAESDTVFINPEMVIDGHYVSYIQPYQIIEHPDLFIECGLTPEAIAKMDPEDNPIIIFYDFIFYE